MEFLEGEQENEAEDSKAGEIVEVSFYFILGVLDRLGTIRGLFCTRDICRYGKYL